MSGASKFCIYSAVPKERVVQYASGDARTIVKKCGVAKPRCSPYVVAVESSPTTGKISLADLFDSARTLRLGKLRTALVYSLMTGPRSPLAPLKKGGQETLKVPILKGGQEYAQSPPS